MQVTKKQTYMKKIKFSAIISVIIAVITLLSACEQSTTDNTAIVYKSGEMITNNIIKTYYLASQKINFDINSQQNLANLLSTNNQDSVENEFSLVDNYSQKVEIFAYYSQILKTFEDNRLKTNINKEFLSLLNTADSLDNGDLTQSIKKARDYTLSVNFDTKAGLYLITNLMYNIWLNDVLNWQKTLDKSYEKYCKSVDKIPATVFDETKLAKFVYAPYQGKENLVNVYKLNLKQAAFELKSSFNDKTTTILSAFDLYSQVINELAKSKPDFNFIFLSHEKILSQLNTLDNSSSN